MINQPKIIRTSTVPLSLKFLLKGQLAYLNRFFTVIGVSGAGPDLETVKNRELIRVHEISMERNISPLKDLLSLWRLYRLFRQEKPDMVHSITPKAGLLSMTASYFAGVPLRLHTFTGLIFPSKTGLLQKLLIMMDRLLCYFATHIYPEGKGVRNDLMRFRITDKPLKILASGNVNGIDTAYFSRQSVTDAEMENVRRNYGLRPDDFVFIFVGRLVKDKGINELVAAFKEIQYSQLNTRKSKLLLVGPLEQDLDPLFQETLKEIEGHPDIITAGFQEDVRPFFAVSSALAFPSYREGFPNVVMQAGAMGLPAIVTDINGCNEIIEDGKNGLIIPPKDSRSLQQKMTNLVNRPALRQELAANARPMIVSRYRQEVVWEALLQEYRSLLDEKNK